MAGEEGQPVRIRATEVAAGRIGSRRGSKYRLRVRDNTTRPEGKGPCFAQAFEAVEDEGIAVRLTPPERSRTLQRTLYRTAKQEPAYRFYALYDTVYRADILGHADDLVRANKGASGVDGVTFEAIEAGEGVDAFLATLAEALQTKTYRPDPVRRVFIPQGHGEFRPLGIPTIRDRVAQVAAKLVIEPVFEADFELSARTGFGPSARPMRRWMMWPMRSVGVSPRLSTPTCPNTSIPFPTLNCWRWWPSVWSMGPGCASSSSG